MGSEQDGHGEAPLERPNWFDGRLITSDDLDADQSYFRERMRRRNRLLHGWGVVSGLEVTVDDGLFGLVISPGMALDAAGNEIVLDDPATVVPTEIGLGEAGRMYWLAIRWDETPSGLVPAPGGDGDPVINAWRESFLFAALGRQPDDAAVAPTLARTATPWLALATVVWDGEGRLTIDTSVRRPLQLPTEA